MDIEICIQDEAPRYASGDTVVGKIRVRCAQPTTISRFTVALIGESTSSLTGASGLRFSRRQEETHTFLREDHSILPSLQTSTPREIRPIRLDVGCHSFDFRLRIPRVQVCASCPPNTPVECESDQDNTEDNTLPLPPSTSGLQKGNEVSYRIEVAVTTTRNMFKSRTIKRQSITIWPIDPRSMRCDRGSAPAASIVTARATVLGPNDLPLPSHIHAEDVLRMAPAEILISAFFRPDFELVRNSAADAKLPYTRKIQVDISAKKLNQHPQDLYLQSFQMLLVGYTDISAGAAKLGYMTFWTLRSLSNLDLPIFRADNPSGSEHTIDSRLWDGVTLDDDIVPNFTSCNLGRRYELELLMGWQCKSGEHAGRTFFVQVRTPVRISSGVQRSTQSCKLFRTVAKDGTAESVDHETLSLLARDESERARARISAPPSYDEAICTAG